MLISLLEERGYGFGSSWPTWATTSSSQRLLLSSFAPWFFLRGGHFIFSLCTGKRLKLTFPIQYTQILGWIFRDNHLCMHRQGTDASGNQRLTTSNLWKVNLHQRHLYADLPRETPAGILQEQEPNAAIQAEKAKDKTSPVLISGMRTVT